MKDGLVILVERERIGTKEADERDEGQDEKGEWHGSMVSEAWWNETTPYSKPFLALQYMPDYIEFTNLKFCQYLLW